MDCLSRKFLNESKELGTKVGNKEKMPVKIMQFGEGNFLRAFVDYMVDELNSNNIFNGSIAVIQPIENGLVDILNSQDGLYTLFLRGLSDGKEVSKSKIITSISSAINPYKNFDDYINLAKSSDIRFIVSNTTEAGIAYNPADKLADKPQISFPGKITAFLHERYKHFGNDNTKGIIFIPCELIDYNGTTLKNIVMQYAKEWSLEADFIDWVKNSNYFTNTLVDRIVTGYPKDEVSEMTQLLGYEDKLLNTAEIFHFWVIEGPKELSKELPFDKIGLNVLWTDDATPYKQRKVRILNGAHTMSVLAGFLCGKDTVGQLMKDERFKKFLEIGLFQEVIPTLDLEYSDLETFANSVFDRFANPFINHYLLSISLNSISKYKTRVLPSILEYYDRKGDLPKLLTFSFAAMLAFYKGTEIRENQLIGHRNFCDNEEYKINDDLEVLKMFKDLWSTHEMTLESTEKLVQKVCAKTELWSKDLNTLEGFHSNVSEYLFNILKNGMDDEVTKVVC